MSFPGENQCQPARWTAFLQSFNHAVLTAVMNAFHLSMQLASLPTWRLAIKPAGMEAITQATNYVSTLSGNHAIRPA
jgi:hypothetical protein